MHSLKIELSVLGMKQKVLRLPATYLARIFTLGMLPQFCTRTHCLDLHSVSTVSVPLKDSAKVQLKHHFLYVASSGP